MKKLLLRMVREIKNSKGQFISIVLITAIGAFMFSGMLASILSIKKGVSDYYLEQNLADLWVNVKGVSEEQVADLRAETNLEIEGRYTANLDAVIGDSNVSLRAHSLTDINAVSLSEGSLPDKQFECVVDSKFAKANDLEPGDTLSLYSSAESESGNVTDGSNRILSIVGIADNPEYAHKVKDGATALISHKTFGIVYSTEDTLAELLKESRLHSETTEGRTSTNNDGGAMSDSRKNIPQFQELLIKTEDIPAALAMIEQKDYTIAYTERENQASYVIVNGGIDTISTVSYVFPVVFFMVAALILLISMAKMVENQRRQLAVIQAIGVSKRKVRMSFLFYALAASALGSFLFSFLGNLLIPKVLLKMFTTRFSFVTMEAVFHPLLLVAPFLLASVCSCIAAILAVRGVLKEVPAQAMRPKPPKKSKTILIERMGGLWRRLSYSAKLICRNIFLNKTRILLSSIGVISSVMLMITGLSLQNAATSLIESKQESIGYDLSVVYTNEIQRAEDLSFSVGVDTIELTQSIRATLPEYDSSTTLQILPVNSQLIRLYNPEEERLTVTENSVLIPQTLAEDYDLEPGDQLELTIEDVSYLLTITGIAVQYSSNIIYIEEMAAQNAGLELSYNTAMVRLSDSRDTLTVKEELTGDSKVRAVNSKSEQESSTRENLEMLNVIIVIIIVAAAAMSVAVIYNITSINLFERAREFATLMVLGYYKKDVYRLLFTENMVITILGCIGGLPCGIMLFRVILNSFSGSGVILPSQVAPSRVIIAYGLTILISIFTNLLLQRKVKEIDMIESLKGVE